MDRTLTKRPASKSSAKKVSAKPTVSLRRKGKVKSPKPALRVRLSPEDRKKLIVDEAICYFAEVGFDGGTRQLALRLGITQPLIFRYFSNKDDLIQAVYNEVFLSRWRIEWEVLLEDRSRPLRNRLIDFYRFYTEVIFNSKWMRIFLYSGLRGLDLNKWYINFAEERIHRRVCFEIRAEKGIKLKGPITGREIELYWVFHGGIFYHGVRQFAYGVPIHLALEEFIEASVDSMLNGMPSALKT
jgi:AcrR family transcriptional regulator